MKWLRGTDDLQKAGLVLLVVGLLLLATSATYMDRDVVAESTVLTNVEYQTTEPLDLPGGSITIWLEDHPDWPRDTWEIDVSLNQSGGMWWATMPGEFRYRDIEGVRCFLAGMFSNSPGGVTQIDIELWDWFPSPPEEVAIFVLSSPSPVVTVGLISGVASLMLGAVILAFRKWPMKKKGGLVVE
jgi:hypothetical protein